MAALPQEVQRAVLASRDAKPERQRGRDNDDRERVIGCGSR